MNPYAMAAGIVALAALAGGAYAMAGDAAPALDAGAPSPADVPTIDPQANRRAFLAMIRRSECGGDSDPYHLLVGGRHFVSLADHPRQYVAQFNSTAAGAYQIIASTWDECKAALSLPDFSPASQDAAALFLIKRRGAMSAVDTGQFADAVSLCRKEWASLPGAGYGQHENDIAMLQSVYENAGGTVA